jgi:PAS domain S-box-containing protein
MEKNGSANRASYKTISFGLLLILCLLATYYFYFVLQTESVFTHLFYLPIILAGLWWRRKAIAVGVFLALLLLASHILSPLATLTGAAVARSIMFVVVGTVVSLLSEKGQTLEERANAAREAQENLLTILDSLADAAIVLDKNLDITWINKIAVEQYGVVLGKKCYEVLKWREEPCSDCVARKTFADGAIRSAEEEGLLKVGSRINFIAGCSPVRDTNDVIVSVVAVLHDITERKRAQEQLTASLQEKEVLLKEIHHRVKNNLQVICSLLDLQSDYIEDEQTLQMFKDSRARVRSMALIHERLYQAQDLTRINFAEYVRSLTNSLFHSYGTQAVGVTLKVNVEDVLLDIDRAIPCGLIINELVSNALKYGFPDGQEGEICIELFSASDEFTLVVRDNGVGFPQDLDFRKTKTLGLKLVTTLAKQLRGAIELQRNGGTEFKLRFAVPERKGRA